MAPLLTHPRYEAGLVLGAGSQGVVFRVTDREGPSRRLVAKLWRPGLFGEEELAGEFALLSRLRIAGVVRAHDLGRDGESGAPFLVEEEVSGPDARAFVAEASGQERGARLFRLLSEVGASLDALHAAGFLHGDLKPAHVRVPPGGRPTLLDLGSAVARARTGAGPRGLSAGYAAPEILAGAPATPASDLYALGALAWASVTGEPPALGGRPPLRRAMGWVPPPLADAIEALTAEHPRDRPEDARALLARLGAGGERLASLPAPLGREALLAALLSGEPGRVRYLTGPSGAGKSHVLRELETRSLLSGREARRLGFPLDDPRLLVRLVAFFRGAGDAFPFGGSAEAWLLLDDLERAPPELSAALDAYRCRGVFRPGLSVLAAAREAPDGADALALEPLEPAVLAEIAGRLGEADPSRREQLARAARGSPGWLLASLGRMPLTAEAVRARAGEVSRAAAELFAATAAVGGRAREPWLLEIGGEGARGALGELLAAALLSRRGNAYELASAQIAQGAGRELATPELTERIARVLCADDEAPPSALLSLAALAAERVPAGEAPARLALLERAAERARPRGLRTEEMHALLALAETPGGRTPARLWRLERLTRDARVSDAHPQVLAWLDEAASVDPRMLPLSLRRRAERLAREGDADGAERLSIAALGEARQMRDPLEEGFALGTRGLVLLFRAAWVQAHEALREARGILAPFGAQLDDLEEGARIDHNLGVVAIYRGRIDEAVAAFERAIDAKERLGDRAGVRASLRNLGYALTRAGRLDEAAAALDRALALARSLGQAAGRAWCLAARAEVEIRRGAPAAAERLLAEAEAIGEAVPAAVRADLALHRAEVSLLEGDGAAALDALARIDPRTRASDAFVEARARLVEARARLCTLPAEPRRSARLAILAIRGARAAELVEPLAEAFAILKKARRHAAPPPRVEQGYAGAMAGPDESALFAWLRALGEGAELPELATSLCRMVIEQAGAERAFLAELGPGGEIARAWGVDLDGIGLGDAERRVPAELLLSALGSAGPVYQREAKTAGGTGSRVAIAAPGPASGARMVVVAEHRFAPGRFDALPASLAPRWASLGAVLGRLAAAAPGAPRSANAEGQPPDAPPAPPPRRAPLAHTTVQPLSRPRRSFPSILGESAALERALERLDAAIDSELPVLVVGETGTGKELFAQAIHAHGPRAAAPFVAVNCAAIADSLFEAELFGHARGAFTGADRARTGLIARAEGGTLFLDEIGELALVRQASLLRVLESRRYRPVGSDEERPARARLVTATNRDLEQAVASGAFRQDLLFRLNVLALRVPPLRERAGDAALLARRFLDKAGSGAGIDAPALVALEAYGWPGNVRELEHLMQRLSTFGLKSVGLEHLPREIRAAASVREPPSRPGLRASPPGERAEVERALEASGGNISQAARGLGLTRHGLKKRMTRLGMRERSEKASL